jgi:protein-S-isoprenylcysteine O-methyltransferase Ste14
MYLGLLLVYLGVTALTISVWALLLLVLPLWVMNARIIPMEERLLEDAFGADYSEYKARVRRWL